MVHIVKIEDFESKTHFNNIVIERRDFSNESQGLI